MSGAVEVEAEVIEGELAAKASLMLDIDGIRRGVEDMDASLRRAEKLLSDDEPSEEALFKMDKDAVDAARGAHIDVMDDYEAARKSVKSLINEPYNRIEAEAKKLMAPLKARKELYSAEMARRERRKKELHREYLEGIYADFCEANGLSALVDLVPFERIVAVNPKWLNLGEKKSAVEGIENKAAEVARDWEALKKLDLDHAEEAEREFFATLSLRAAIKKDEDVEAENARIEALRDEVAVNRAEAVPEPAPEPPHVRRYRLEFTVDDDGLEKIKACMKALPSFASISFKKVNND